jgi:hypothetical protein
MPGTRITPKQLEVYMTLREKGLNQTICTAKAGFSLRSGGNLERRGVLPIGSKKSKSKGKRDNDPLEGVWESVLVPLLEQIPNLTSWTLLEYLQDQFPDKYPDSIIRTMQRRISKWRALYGPEKEIMFRQLHEPGRQGLSDFTSLKNIEITIAGKEFSHLLYHFRLAFSHWSFMKVVHGGESFTALSAGLQDALWNLGACPKEHRTDSLSAAFRNLSLDQQEDMTKSYNELCKHYGIDATRNNRGKGHENGSVESAHGHLKRRLEQALLMRSSYDFDTINDYQQFIDNVVAKHNNRHQAQLYIEMAHLKELPSGRAIDFTATTARVTTSSTITVQKVMYSLPSRLIGYLLNIHIFDDHLSCYLKGEHVLDLPRIRIDKNEKKDKKQVYRCIDYRHLIGSLSMKPGAFRYSILRDDILPSSTYKKIWQLIDEKCTARHADKLMVGMLKLAADYDCEEALGKYVLAVLSKGNIPCLGTLQNHYKPPAGLVPPAISVKQHSLEDYNQLLSLLVMKEVAYA